jgi:shikimate dehydrogenase
MAVHQAAEALRLFSGLEPDPARMLRHLAELVGAETSGADGGAGRVA